MSTLSVPLNQELQAIVGSLVKRGFAPNKAEVVRRAITLLAEEQAIAAVLKSEQEIREGKILRGDLKKLSRLIP